ANQQAPCSSKFEAAVAPECFTSNGINFTGILFIISGNMSGAIPAGHTYSSFLKLVCSPESQDKMIPCVLSNMNKHNTTQCSPADSNLLYGRGGQLLAFLESICGQPCEQVATQSVVQCFSVTGSHPERFLSQNASITDDRYSIIGGNQTEVDSFCKNRQKLFSCLSPLSLTCPGLLQRMYSLGVDLQAMEMATGFLCNDQQKYLRGLQCFNKQSPEIAQCAQTTASSMRAAFTGRYQTGTIPPSKYQDSLCKTKISQITCALAAYGKSCDADVMPLRATVECTMLPKPCKENTQTEYNSVCDKVTTPSPAETIRPTQGKPGMIPVDGGSSSNSNFQSVRSSTNAADIVGFFLATPLILASVLALL
ncbi:unnamed protein product, partial [Candidula unifasciata]